MSRHSDTKYSSYIRVGPTGIFVFSHLAEKGRLSSEYHINHQFLRKKKRPRVPAWHPSDSDSTWFDYIESIKTHCGTFTARLEKNSPFGCRTIPMQGTSLCIP